MLSLKEYNSLAKFMTFSEKNLIILPINGIYYLACTENNSTIAKKRFESVLMRHVDVETLWHSNNLINSNLPSWLINSWQSIISDYLQFEDSNNLLHNYSTNPKVIKFLEAHDGNLFITPASVRKLPPASNLNMLNSYFSQFLQPIILNQNLSGISATRIQIKNNNVSITEPGSLSYRELKAIIPNSYILERSYNLVENAKVQIIMKHNHIIGTREDFKNILHKSNQYNIGSRTNPENIAHNLFINIWQHVNQISQDELIAIEQKFHSHKLSDFINYNLQKYLMVGQI